MLIAAAIVSLIALLTGHPGGHAHPAGDARPAMTPTAHTLTHGASDTPAGLTRSSETLEPEVLVLDDFGGASLTGGRWFTVNDTVMGGRSRGGGRIDGGVMTLSGTLNTNGGGFSSVRAAVRDGDSRQADLSGYDAIRLRVRGDGREYRVSVRTDARVRGREIAYQAGFRAESLSEWTEVVLAFDDFEPSWRGMDMTRFAPEFDPGATREIGVILGDGIDGPFWLEIDRIEAVRTAPSAGAPNNAGPFAALAGGEAPGQNDRRNGAFFGGLREAVLASLRPAPEHRSEGAREAGAQGDDDRAGTGPARTGTPLESFNDPAARRSMLLDLVRSN